MIWLHRDFEGRFVPVPIVSAVVPFGGYRLGSLYIDSGTPKIGTTMETIGIFGKEPSTSRGQLLKAKPSGS